jgi:hypothetical protein
MGMLQWVKQRHRVSVLWTDGTSPCRIALVARETARRRPSTLWPGFGT